MTTTVPRNTPSMQNLGDIDSMSQALIELGYTVISRNQEKNSLTTVIEVMGCKYPVLIDINDDGTAAQIEIRVAKAGCLPDDVTELAAAAMNLLALNAEITPFAITVYPPERAGVTDADEAPITLLDEIPIGDLSAAELESSLMSARRALLVVCKNISAFAPQKCSPDCGCR